MACDYSKMNGFFILVNVVIITGFLLVVPVIGSENSTATGADLYASGDYTGALSLFEEELSFLYDSDRAPVLNNIGTCYMGLGKHEEALNSFLAAVESDPNYATGWLNAGVAYEALKDTEKALECYNKVIDLDPGNSGGAFVMKGGLLAGIGETEAALLAYQEAEKSTNSTIRGQALNGKGAIYFLQGMNEEAKKAFLAAIEEDPTGSAMARTNLGVLYVYEGRYEDARTAFKEAMDLDPLGKTGAAGYYDALNAMIDTKSSSGEVSKQVE